MIRRLTLLVSVLSTLLLASCEGGGPPPIEPVSYPPGDKANFQISASTNCAEIGEVVTFTARIGNAEKYAVILVGDPALDIVVQPVLWPQTEVKPVRRWSDSDQYPQQIVRTFLPGEERTYTWKWVAENIHAKYPATLLSVDFATAALVNPSGGGQSAGTISIAIGVDRTRTPSGGYVACSELPR